MDEQDRRIDTDDREQLCGSGHGNAGEYRSVAWLFVPGKFHWNTGHHVRLRLPTKT